ncbi:J domain-containing protein [Nocardiopsis valliformis]|uniref:J domain-containing protein n=1 Tax=Nocardiopsis valliformis TaxID=239974 RepID=UPI000346E917|nr:hypothetical protein [Nocardiopsis valliformis]
MAAPPDDDTDFVDYYELLGIPPEADAGTIRDRLDTLILEWQQFTGSGKKELRRRAEDTLEQVAGAEHVLLDPARRAAYDDARRARRTTEATGTPPERPANPGGAPGEQNMAHARAALSEGDHQGARYFSTRATEENPGLADAWFTRYTTCVIMGDFDEAEMAGKAALRLRSDVPLWLVGFGGFLAEFRAQPDQGLRLAVRGARMDPGPEASLKLALIQIRLGAPWDALDTAGRLRGRFPDDPAVRDVVARCLTAAAEAVPDVRVRGGYRITSQEEITQMRRLIALARNLCPEGGGAISGIEEVDRALQHAEEKTLTHRLTSNGITSLALWLSVPLTFALGFGLLLDGVLVGLFLFLVGFALCLVIAVQCSVRRWELNARIT